MATGCTGDVWECKEVWQEWCKVLCAMFVEVEGDSRGVSGAASHREKNAENDL